MWDWHTTCRPYPVHLLRHAVVCASPPPPPPPVRPPPPFTCAADTTMGRKHRQEAVRGGRATKRRSITDKISSADVINSTKALATQTAYARFISGKNGWLEWTAAQGVDSSGLDDCATERVVEYYIYRTNDFSLGFSTGGQILAAIAQHYEVSTRCGGGDWSVIRQQGMPTSTSGNPVHSSEVKNAKGSHKAALARAGNAESDSVDVSEPVHLRTFFSKYLSGRCLHECDPWAVMLHAAVLLSMSCLLRFSELAAMRSSHLGRSERNILLNIPLAIENNFKKSVYELTPWPTAVRLDPRYVCVCHRFVISEGFPGLSVPWMSCFKCRLFVVSDTCSCSPISFVLTVGSRCFSFHSLDPVLAFATWMRWRGTVGIGNHSVMGKLCTWRECEGAGVRDGRAHEQRDGLQPPGILQHRLLYVP